MVLQQVLPPFDFVYSLNQGINKNQRTNKRKQKKQTMNAKETFWYIKNIYTQTKKERSEAATKHYALELNDGGNGNTIALH